APWSSRRRRVRRGASSRHLGVGVLLDLGEQLIQLRVDEIGFVAAWGAALAEHLGQEVEQRLGALRRLPPAGRLGGERDAEQVCAALDHAVVVAFHWPGLRLRDARVVLALANDSAGAL